MYKVGMISLGCPKNQVDAERILALLDKNGFEIVNCYDGCDAVIVNACCFIEAARREAIENILDMVRLKEEGTAGKVVVAGCLSQRYKEEILKEIPEADAVIGPGANGNVAEIVKRVIEGEKIFDVPDINGLPLSGERLSTTPEYWSYLKIAEGCSNRCSYCVIPSIRGNFRSVELETLTEEAKKLAASGVKELVLVAQDVANYGTDLYGKPRLPEALDALCEIDGIEWIRLLYCYPDRITDELLETMARQPKVLPYIDLPIQHADDGILKAMNRRGDSALLREVIAKIRAKLPDAAIRTTVMVGFPGEGEEEFENLAEFINEIEFDRLGCFVFSPEEGTPAFDMENQVEEETKLRRSEIITRDQLEITALKNAERIGKTYRVLVEDYDPYGDAYKGRTYMDAPEIDGNVFFTTDRDYEPGDFADVVVVGVNDYDLVGRDVLAGGMK